MPTWTISRFCQTRFAFFVEVEQLTTTTMMTQQIPVWWGKHRQSFEQKADDTFGETFELFVDEFWRPSKAACWRPDRSERSGSVGKVWRGLAGLWVGAGEALEEGRPKNHRSFLKWLQNESQKNIVYRDRFGTETNWYQFPTDNNKRISYNLCSVWKTNLWLVKLDKFSWSSYEFYKFLPFPKNRRCLKSNKLPSWFENGLPALGRSGVGGQKTFFEIGSHTMFPSFGSLWESSRRHFPSESKKNKNVGILKTNFKVELELEDIFPLKTTKNVGIVNSIFKLLEEIKKMLKLLRLFGLWTTKINFVIQYKNIF